MVVQLLDLLAKNRFLRQLPVKDQISACCWALVCAYCVGSRHKMATGSNDPDWLPSGQDLMDHVIIACPEMVPTHTDGSFHFDEFNCHGLLPEDSLKFVRRFGIRYESEYPFNVIRNEHPPPWSPQHRRIYICDYKILRSMGDGLTEESAYESLSGGPIMGSVLQTVEFEKYKGGIIKKKGDPEKDKAHSVAIVGIDPKKKCFIIVNTHGRDWGVNGKGWIRYHLVFDILEPVHTTTHWMGFERGQRVPGRRREPGDRWGSRPLVAFAAREGSVKVIRKALQVLPQDYVTMKFQQQATGNVSANVSKSDVDFEIVGKAISFGVNVRAPDVVKSYAGNIGAEFPLHKISNELTSDVRTAIEGLLETVEGSNEGIRQDLKALPQDIITTKFLLQASGNFSKRLIDDVQTAVQGLLETVQDQLLICSVELRAVSSSGSGHIVGCIVTEGKVVIDCGIQVLRKGRTVLAGVKFLRQIKEAVREGSIEAIRQDLQVLPRDNVTMEFLKKMSGNVSKSDVDLAVVIDGLELSIGIDDQIDWEAGDTSDALNTVQKPQTLEEASSSVVAALGVGIKR